MDASRDGDRADNTADSTADSTAAAPRRGIVVHPTVERLAAYSWRLIVIGIVGLAGLWLIGQIRLVLIPVVIALFLARGLAPISEWLCRHRWRRGLASIATMLGFFLAIAGVTALIVPSIADQLGTLGPTLTAALDDVEDWLVDDSPFDVSRESIERFRDRTGQRIDSWLADSDGQVLDQATLAAEIIAGALLSVILLFFMLRDGTRFVDWSLGHARRRAGRCCAVA